METILLATRSLTRNPLRTGLTMLGMAIGVAAFIAMVSFGQGARSAVVQQFEKLGVNMLTVTPRNMSHDGRIPIAFTERDVQALEARSYAIEMVAPLHRQNTFLVQGQRQTSSILMSTSPAYFDMLGWQFALGGHFNQTDLRQTAKVCVLGATPAQELFPNNDNPLGEKLTVHGELPCRVVGIMKPKGKNTGGRDLDNLVLIPYTTYNMYLVNNAKFWYLQIRPVATISRGAAISEIRETLRITRNLSSDAEDDFVIKSSDDAVEVASSVAQILSGLLAGIAAVSLLVGGIGIMNIQLVAVAERTREIGIRSAIGASPQQILRQFLAEAIALSLCGTLLGSVGGITLAISVAHAMNWEQTLSISALVLAIAFGGGVGVFFGYLPAARAARLDPIEALRSE
ncbi:MAG: ABC transporter permease [Myxococcales bacterium]|nr:ABC transporter permease [Myxococcales bacterium]